MSNIKSEEDIKGFKIQKNVNPPAKIKGLYYNTFFIWVVISALILLLGAANGLIGFSIAAALIGIVYLILYYLQTLYGPKKVAKLKNYFFSPINLFKMKKNFKRNF